MTRIFTVLTCALAFVPASQLPAQAVAAEYRLKKCDDPKPEIGFFRGEGVVSYVLAPDGRTDTASVHVLSVMGVSAAGFRSVAVRQLSACRFELGGDGEANSVLVQQHIVFDSARAQFHPPQRTLDGVLAPVQDSMTLTLPSGPIDVADPRVEERPRMLACDRPFRPQRDLNTRFGSRQEAEMAMQDWERRNTGLIAARALLGADGHIVRDSISVISTTNPNLTTDLVGALASCRYAPARMRGIPIPVFIPTRLGSRVQVETTTISRTSVQVERP